MARAPLTAEWILALRPLFGEHERCGVERAAKATLPANRLSEKLPFLPMPRPTTYAAGAPDDGPFGKHDVRPSGGAL